MYYGRQKKGRQQRKNGVLLISIYIFLTIHPILKLSKDQHSWLSGQQKLLSNTKYILCTPFEESPQNNYFWGKFFGERSFQHVQLSINGKVVHQ